MNRRTALQLFAAASAGALAGRAASGSILFGGGRSAGEPHQATAPFRPTWQSLTTYTPPRWFADAKFGIFFHWGLYSVPAFDNEWYSRNMYQTDRPEYKHHLATYGPLHTFGYKNFAPMFRAEHWDPDAWVSLFEEAGARYVGIVAEHADGFSMWNSRVNRWNAVNFGPKRDAVRAMEGAVRRRNLKFLTSLHHHWLWGWYCSQDTTADIYDPTNAWMYWPHPYAGKNKGAFNYAHPDPPPSRRFVDVWLNKVKEVVDGYQPDVLYFDSRLSIIPEPVRQEVLAYFYNQAERAGREVVLTYKGTDLAKGSAVFDTEAGQLKDKADFLWQTDDELDWDSWAYLQQPNFKSPLRVIRQLVDIVSKNGNLLLDVGPRPDGTLPEGIITRLRAIGAWLRVNGEAIYGTRPWSTFGEGPTQVKEGYYVADHNKDFTAKDIRFTTSERAFYVHILGNPGPQVHVASITRDTPLPFGRLREIALLGTPGNLRWQWTPTGLTVDMPGSLRGEDVLVLRLSA